MPAKKDFNARAALAKDLLTAVVNEEAVAVKKLLQEGADANTATTGGTTVLMKAVENADVETMRLLISHGADTRSKDPNGNTVLLRACYTGGYPDVVRLLLDNGAAETVNAQNVAGMTPLMELAECGPMHGARGGGEESPDSVEMLLSCGAALKLKNEFGDTALDRAMKRERSHPQTLKLLQEAAAIETREEEKKLRAEADRERDIHARMVQNQRRLRDNAPHVRLK